MEINNNSVLKMIAQGIFNKAIEEAAIRSISRESVSPGEEMIMSAIISALNQAPPGWQLVPISPTKEQLDAAFNWSKRTYGIPVGAADAIGCYESMIGAIPNTPDTD